MLRVCQHHDGWLARWPNARGLCRHDGWLARWPNARGLCQHYD